MNIIEASKLVGGFPVTQGFWKNVMVTVGLMGAAIMFGLLFILKSGLMLALLIVFLVMSSLGLYIPIEYVYGCMDAKGEINFFFSSQNKNQYLLSELNECHRKSCRECQQYYQMLAEKIS